MKITANEIKPGMIIEHKNDYWNVLKIQHVKPGKGGAFNQVEMKSINSGTKINERFRSSETVEKATVEEDKFSFIYKDKEEFVFMFNYHPRFYFNSSYFHLNFLIASSGFNFGLSQIKLDIAIYFAPAFINFL